MRRLLLFFLLLVPSLTVADKAGFTVKLPDGLYLYQPNAGDEVLAKGDKDTVRPLVIVEKGKFVDPFLRAQEIGFEKFVQKYVTGKTFNVYVGPEQVGVLSNVEFATCSRGEFVPDILGRGRYTGRALPTVPSRYITNHPIYIGIKMVMTPVTVLGDTLQSATATNVKDIATMLEKAREEIARTAHDEYAPSFILGGTLDIDQDGFHEIIVQRIVESSKVPGDTGVKIEINRHSNRRWDPIFHTVSIRCH